MLHYKLNMMHARQLFSSLWIVGIATSAAIVASIVFQQPAAAISNVAPDGSEYGNAGSYIRLSLSDVPNTKGLTRIKVPVFLKAPAPTTSSPSNVTVRANIRINNFRPISGYTGDGNTYSDYAVWIDDGPGGGAAQCSRSGNTENLTAGNFEWDDTYGLWRTTITAELRNRACTTRSSAAKSDAGIDFRMRVTSYTYQVDGFAQQTVSPTSGDTLARGGNAWISYAAPDQTDPDADSYYFSTNARRNRSEQVGEAGSNTDYATYSLVMATPCTVTTGQSGVIELFDLDNNHRDNGPDSLNDRVRVTVTRTDVTPSQSVPLSVAPGNEGMGNGQRYLRRMTFEPGARYILRIEHIYHWNVLQYRLPFDNIAYVAGCPGGEMTPVLNLVPPVSALSNNGTTQAQFSINNKSPITASAQTTARIWYENNGDDTFNSGDTQVFTRSGPSDTATASVVSQIFQEGITANSALGDRICVSWQLTASNDGRVTVDTQPKVICVPIVSGPLLKVLGNDVRVGSSFATGNNVSSTVYGMVTDQGGSWVEYAITAPGEVVNFASQSGAVNGSADPQSAWSKLTFANTLADCGSYGCFTNDPARLGKIPSVREGLLSSGGSIVHNEGLANVSTSRINTILGGLTNINQSAVIVTTGNITIDSDITYSPGPFTGAQTIPQLILIGNNITIMGGVHRIDAWLIASGTVSTCGDVTLRADLRSTNCDQTLTINGPVMADTLLLNRTYKNPTAPAEPAETVNLRADAYIWANNRVKQAGSWQTVYATELPPRY